MGKGASAEICCKIHLKSVKSDMDNGYSSHPGQILMIFSPSGVDRNE